MKKKQPNTTIIHISVRSPSTFSSINNKLQSVSFIQLIIKNTMFLFSIIVEQKYPEKW